MLFGKKFDDKEVECRFCKKIIKPIIQRNKLKDNFYGEIFSGLEKKYIIICPNCKAIIDTKD
jgi:hypothetical protein